MIDEFAIPIGFLVLTVLYGLVTLLAIAIPLQRSTFDSLGTTRSSWAASTPLCRHCWDGRWR